MRKKKREVFWNLLVLVTVVFCLLAFAAHYKNWTRISADEMTILSGIYYHKLKFTDIEKVEWTDQIPPMQRRSGFSAFEKGKGIYQEFADSLTDKKVYVFVDNFKQAKIKISKKEGFPVYLNFKDSLETLQMFEVLQEKRAALE